MLMQNLPPVFASRQRSSQSYNSDFHLHESYEFYLLIDGEIDYFVERACYRLRPGSLLLFDDKTIHKSSNFSNMPFERVSVHFDPWLAHDLSTGKTDLLRCFAGGEDKILQLTVGEMEQFLSVADRIVRLGSERLLGADVLQNACLMELLVFVGRCFDAHKSSPPPVRVRASRLRPFLEYVEEHLTDDLSLDCLARGLSVSKSTISHVFKEETGSTPSRYITARRIALAKRLLLDGASVTEACMQCGFNDYANFIRVFKAVTGISPGQYRKTARRSPEG
ncbi:MAG: AraC family transcriptional regulator [Oscillospiraceae bacterium]|nr:AraC family transcriptional regulator [Oscillospiraceae bacterium]